METYSTELRRILLDLEDLPVRKSLTLTDLAHDGFGGMVVFRSSQKTYVFQREFYKGRSRWADSHTECAQELECYLLTGKLQEPDKVRAF
jgi:hypothetical protein